MITELYSIKDVKVRSYLKTFEAEHEVIALRMIETVMSDKNSSISRYPSDFELHRVGAFNSENGVLLGEENGPVLIKSCAEIAEKFKLKDKKMNIFEKGDEENGKA